MTIGLGGYIVGSEAPVEGRIRNLNIFQSGSDGIQATYEHEGFEDGVHHALIYINGRLVAVDNTGVAVATGLSEGFQNINVVPQLESSPVSEIFFDEEDGRRVLLEWTPSAQDIAGYRIYSVNLDGTNPVEIDTVTDKLSDILNYDYPHTGTGLGRISCPATVLPEDAFGSVEIVITGNGAATYSYNGEAPTAVTFTLGTVTHITHNIPVVWQDEIEQYVTGDTWTITTGIHPHWLSEDLDPGSYRYGIQSYDAYGNESAIVLTDTYEVVDQAEPVLNEVVTWDDSTNILSIDYDLPVDAASVRLYTNFNSTEGSFEPYVQIQATAEGTGVSPFEISFGSAEGTFLYYLMPVTALGAELQDFSLRSMSMPPSPSDLGTQLNAPESLTGSPSGIDNWLVEWSYFYEPADNLTQFTIHRVASGDPFTLDVTDTVGTVSAGSTGHGFSTDYSFTMTGESTGPQIIDVCVVAHNLSGDTMISETVTITTIGSIVLDSPSGIQGGTV